MQLYLPTSTWCLLRIPRYKYPPYLRIFLQNLEKESNRQPSALQLRKVVKPWGGCRHHSWVGTCQGPNQQTNKQTLELHIIPPNSFKPTGFPVSRTSQVHQFLELAREPLHWGRSYVVSYRKSFWVRCQGIPDGFLYLDWLRHIGSGEVMPKISDISSVLINNMMKSYFFKRKLWRFLEHLRTGQRGRSLVNIWPSNAGLPACFRSINAAGHLGGDWIDHSCISWPTSPSSGSPLKRSPI